VGKGGKKKQGGKLIWGEKKHPLSMGELVENNLEDLRGTPRGETGNRKRGGQL